MITFPSPILCVASDVVQELDGEDAVYGLWTLFTKCKASLTDGPRLENISWRLWYREMSCNSALQHSPGSVSPLDSPTSRSSTPLTPVSESSPAPSRGETATGSLLAVEEIQTAHSWHGEKSTPTALNVSRRLSTASMPARPNTRVGTQQHAGKFIVGILPDKLVIPPRTSALSQTSSKPGTKVRDPTVVSRPQGPIAQPQPVVPAVRLPPSTPPSASGSAVFPKVVVVQPTPHPTPPATPQGSHHVTAIPAHSASTHLLPPPVRRPVFVADQTSELSLSKPSPVPKPNAILTTAGGEPKDPDVTIKPSDKRFFLQQSPDQISTGSRSPEEHDLRNDDPPEPSPSSGTSSHVKSDGITSGNMKRATGKMNTRRSKEVVRHNVLRPVASRVQLQRAQAAQRRANDAKRTTFNIGSNSSNGSKHTHTFGGGAQKSHVPHPDQDVPNPRPRSPPKNGNAHTVGRAGGSSRPPVAPTEEARSSQAAPANRRGLVISTSSEYETTDTDDDSDWASENDSLDEQELARQREETRLREAAEEAQRQRDMFAKVPKRSYSNLNRSKSGLLSQLLNPDPTIFPPNHPYRSSMSSLDMTQLGRTGRAPVSTLSTSKSTVALPQAAAVTAQAPLTNGSGPAQDPRGYRPKGRPDGAEMEDDSDDDTEDNAIQLSKSLAQQKLAALTDPNRRRKSDHGPPPPEPTVPRPTLTTVATAPIPLGHPYNLPAPAPPTTPRTTRRQMLSTELSESLRRNLLWERQVSKINMTGGARRNGLLGGGLRPLTAVNNGQPAAGDAANPADVTEAEKRRRASVARNRSWADDYHYAGW